jgi:hypothetical protein
MTAVNALLEGEVDYLETVPFDLTPMVKSAPDVELRILDKMGRQLMPLISTSTCPPWRATPRPRRTSSRWPAPSC